MILIIPAKKVDLSGLPCWFVKIYVAAYGVAFAAMLASVVYMISQLVG